MHTKPILILTALLLLSFPGCQEANGADNRPEAAFYSEQGASLSLHLIFDLENKNRLSDRSEKPAVLTVPSESINPWTFFSDGDFFVSTDDKNANVYGSYYFTKVESENVERIIAVFRRKGSGEKALGCPAGSGTIFSIDGAQKATAFGECRFQEITGPDGQKRTVRVSRLLPAGAWSAALGDKIYLVEETGRLVHKGWVEWRTITTPEGKTLVVLMTRGMAQNSAWAGRFDGVLFADQKAEVKKQP